MTTCARCHAPLGVGRYCTNCGHRIDGDLPPASAPLPASAPAEPSEPTEPAPAHEPPPPARFPLWADADAEAPAETTGVLPLVAAPPPPPGPGRSGRAGSGLLVGVLVAGAAVVALVVIGALLLVGGDDSARDAAATAPSAASADAAPSEAPTTSDTPSPSSPSASASATPASDEAQQLAGLTSVTAPPAGGSSTDVATGEPIDYVAENLVDGDPATCWRTPGDASGREIVLRLPERTDLVEVGLVNGYAKTSRAGGRVYDWYHGNRRVLSVQWTFDDGRTIVQDLRDTRSLQRLDVTGVRTETVRLRLLAVSAPGTGPAGKDNTAISEISLLGTAPQDG
ncbi:hypothetical protein K8Z61_02340 [Nocardioides sp. TRM66260-LWL]|uniref:NADase-type glycan-binding domain-containing protein n=1 Tax=Nocardioides sp. TRM66260-LWL TaxID=2874478 RepID=UPI001CC81AA5|nr:hypothetical protein [Nocardioides sp. TRM66260-LWL]MBZ5733324.1 hypothetical protein [Nocardioides sp. TRM66260-LWL]